MTTWRAGVDGDFQLPGVGGYQCRRCGNCGGKDGFNVGIHTRTFDRLVNVGVSPWIFDL